jgi:hypothetical protein
VSVRVATLVLAGALAAAAPLAAQRVRFAGADGEIYRIRFHGAVPGGEEALSGLAAGARARLVRGSVAMEVSVAQGRFSSGDASAPARSLVEAALAFTYRLRPWFALRAGPHLRGYVAPAGTERWVLWETGARAEGSIIPGVLDAHLAGWLALLSSVNTDPGAAGARGGEAGLTLQLAQLPIALRLAYSVDRADFAHNVRRETVESVYLGLTYTRR